MSDAAAELTFCLRLMRAQSALTRKLDQRLSNLHGLSFGDFMILHHLRHAEAGRLRRTELAACLGLTVSGATRALLPLEKIGLVERQADARDARVGYACLSPAGAELYQHARLSADQACRDAMRGVAPADIELLLAALAPLNGDG
ncbi:MarR family transcriptional regulator [Chromobacterium alkanivorans]|uniref:MarR family winged helix-turn-helix transcriptional regulator n=1 Tax=Chromobacterium alkanivorans TaxID=1071719 RepID=UPI001967A0E1|nr:MarR family transcriptional regulator [Chromobacterium alkanivorans]MBN3002886.1 MarR family transcriptional regulator [Chromobacterium alkanivorans]